MKVTSGVYSTKGVRPQNEDSYICNTDNTPNGPMLFAVADGMGGHAAGDVASQFVVKALKDFTTSNSDVVTGDSLEALLKRIHNNLLEEGKKRGTPNMGTTITGIVLQDGECGIFNVGDSRTYRLRNGILQQLSRDDSLASIVPDAAKNIITNALGAGLNTITVQQRFSKNIAVPGDLFFMCSDGVHGAIDDDGLAEMLENGGSLDDIAKTIVEKAIENGSDDNCTAVIVRIE
ncbi:MAG: protein phosphatase 2C domain-containing protein [Spirochaetaceae bacterium]|jgi:protein phosphatase|nr:protein phosphatase 2C domain-containing protein [Spirochaetaceae bacterium]